MVVEGRGEERENMVVYVCVTRRGGGGGGLGGNDILWRGRWRAHATLRIGIF